MTAAMKPSEALRKARELITPEGAWIQGDFARDAQGILVGFRNKHAVCFCMRGALYHSEFSYGLENLAESFLRRVTKTNDVAHWNDERDRTQRQALTKYDEAIALAEAEGC